MLSEQERIIKKITILNNKIQNLQNDVSSIKSEICNIEKNINKLCSSLLENTPPLPRAENTGKGFNQEDSNEVLDDFLNQPQGIQNIRIK